MFAFFWTITEFKRRGRIEPSFYSTVKIVFVVCLLLFFRRREDVVVGNPLTFCPLL